MWLFDSSVGRKFVMSITGASLVLFLLFHATMNVVVAFSPEGYNAICAFLGANWYALIGTLGLAFLLFVHFVYAFILSIRNYRARGTQRYAVVERQEGVDWASNNMLVLGLIVIGFLLLHLYNFWFKMQFVEITGIETGPFSPTDGASYVKALFSNPIYCVLYLIWLTAIWFHLTHGVWSALQSLGLSSNIWLPRIKCIGNIVATLIVLMFAFVVVFFCVSALIA
ncbi:MAG: succinate dehydrogenase cytochrome b subunit [Bacteroidia bacterium]|nr:succinate dehydrogenase cytochrome b subunit [Bacteroidia bacterium]